MVEKPLDPYLDPNIIDRSPFYLFRDKMISFYEATKKYYRSLIAGIEADTE